MCLAQSKENCVFAVYVGISSVTGFIKEILSQLEITHYTLFKRVDKLITMFTTCMLTTKC